MAKRFLSQEEVHRRLFEYSSDDDDNLDELNSSESRSDSENDDFSPLTSNALEDGNTEQDDLNE